MCTIAESVTVRSQGDTGSFAWQEGGGYSTRSADRLRAAFSGAASALVGGQAGPGWLMDSDESAPMSSS
jgi:hypothetical protein